MVVFYTVDERFVSQLAASVVSVCINNATNDRIVFFIGELNVPKDQIFKLERLISSYGREVVFIALNGFQTHIHFDVDTTGWNEIVLARLLIGQLLPKTISRLLYLDADTIVLGDLSELWSWNLNGKTIAASSEPTVNRVRRRRIGLENAPYYNAGVMLIDMEQWRKTEAEQRILSFYSAHSGKLFANDQDAINGALVGEIAMLPPAYNYFNIFWFYPYKMLRKLYEPAEYLTEKEYLESCERPLIVHFLGEERPWRRGNFHPYRHEYEYYLSETAWRNELPETGWEVYLFCFKLPKLRYRIIDSLIPSFIRFRKKQRKKALP